MNQEYKKKLAGWLIIIFGLLLFYGLLPYLNGIFGSLILWTLFSPLYNLLLRCRMGKKMAAILIILISLIVLVLPLSMIVTVIINEIRQLISREMFLNLTNQLRYIFPGFDLTEFLKNQAPAVVGTTQDLVRIFFSSLVNSIINILIMYFLLFYLLTNKEKIYKKTVEVIPFKRESADKLITEFKDITNSTILTTGLIAVIQGALITAGFLFFRIEGAFLWGFVAFLSSFLPFLGAALVWVPASLIFLFQQDYFVGIGMFLWGLFVSSIDNFIRPFIQNKIKPIHPLIIFMGVFVGIPLFGILGIFIGPLLISYFLLTTDMFVKEYVKPDEK